VLGTFVLGILDVLDPVVPIPVLPVPATPVPVVPGLTPVDVPVVDPVVDDGGTTTPPELGPVGTPLLVAPPGVLLVFVLPGTVGWGVAAWLAGTLPG
jgi:hypothetical protein